MNSQTGGWLALVALCGLLGSCGGSVDPGGPAPGSAAVSVSVVDPSATSSQAKFRLLALFAGGCPSDQDLAAGKLASAESIQKIPQLDASFNVSGLDVKKIAFVGMFRRDDCGVVAFGCTPADLTVHKYVMVQVEPVTPPTGACASGVSCVDGQCAP